MTSKNQILTKQELQEVIENRVSMDHTIPEKIIYGKEINDEVLTQKGLLFNNAASIQPLRFNECTFNAIVDIGIYQNAGRIKFHNCTFNSPIKVQFDNSSFSGDCVFNNDLTIRLSKDIEISNYNVKGNFVVLGVSKKLLLKNINQEQEIKDQTIRINGEFSELIVDSVSGKVLEFSSNLNISEELIVKNVDVLELLIGMIGLYTEMKINDCRVGVLKFQKITGVIKGLNIFNSVIEGMEFQISASSKTSIIGGTINVLRLFNSNQEDSIINIEKTTVLNLKFEGIFNNGSIIFKRIKYS